MKFFILFLIEATQKKCNRTVNDEDTVFNRITHPRDDIKINFKTNENQKRRFEKRKESKSLESIASDFLKVRLRKFKTKKT